LGDIPGVRGEERVEGLGMAFRRIGEEGGIAGEFLKGSFGLS
jgi:hypothetical protein